ncbi:helix-turn-helix transcriptional regulator [Kribbella shirazensis]|uniref:DNA-binding CsgD family transcriptional regulator n=1 Tax=Kribbella shirazensis TaxID=1105143 RepID=A0A7X5VCK7_9ACTN|nr:LuxR family transcriptional regulator [Kribbella shirazensis]NIK58499.1 DNA-binding CsgD family transcriptional regulator [Kribbella shirazensis]
MLYGRGVEQGAIEQLWAEARAGRGGALLLSGDPGVGKSALLDFAAERAHGATVLRASGLQSESELPYAALHQLLRPLLPRVGDLPSAQSAAIRAAFGLMPLRPTDRLQVTLGALTLLSESANERPLVCLVDDLQWLDRQSVDALSLLANRIQDESLMLLVATRPSDAVSLPGAVELRLQGVDAQSASEMLADRHPELSQQVAERVVRETGGNPLALSELPGALTDRQRAGIDPLVGPLPLPECILRHYANQLARIEEPTYRLLLTLAADDAGDLAAALRVVRPLGIGIEALDTAVQSGLVRAEETIAGPRVVFRHPLLRAAVYRSASLSQRLSTHRALAEALDPEFEPDRRAWQLAAAAVGPDEVAADELERSGLRALQRGAPSSATVALEKAARLTSLVEIRARRLVAAAGAANRAGHPVRAEALADESEHLAESVVTRARVRHLRALIAFDRGEPGTVHRLLMTDWEQVGKEDPELAAVMLVDAAKNAWFSNDPERAARVAQALSAVVLPPHSSRASLVRTVLKLTDQLERLTGTGLHPQPMGHDTEEGPAAQQEPLELVLRAVASIATADDAAAIEAAEAAVQRCRSTGRLDLLVLALQVLATLDVLVGRHQFARANATEGLDLANALGLTNRTCHFQALLAWLDAVAGRADSCRELAASALGHAEARGITPSVAFGRWALSLLDLGLGRPAETLEQTPPFVNGSAEHPLVMVLRTPDLVEAAARLGRVDELKDNLEQLSAWAASSGLARARALDARCRALVADDADEADRLYSEALALHDEADRTGQSRPFDRARTQLLYGEWLRRQRRRAEARSPLRAALNTFEQLRAEPWTRRAESELRAAGSARRSTAAGPATELTPQELQVVRLAREGASNREIGAQLFLSPRTVGYHLQNIFRKLGIRSRVELAQANVLGEDQV